MKIIFLICFHKDQQFLPFYIQLIYVLPTEFYLGNPQKTDMY